MRAARKYCVVCRTLKVACRQSRSVEYLYEHALWAEPHASLLARVPAKYAVRTMACRRCVAQLRDPLLVRDATGRLLRLAVLPSDVVRTGRPQARVLSDGRRVKGGARVPGLVAVDALPCDTALPYGGRPISTAALLAVEERFGLVISPEWLVDAGSAGDAFLAFGQFVPAGNRFRVAHRVNAKRSDDSFRPNCQFGSMTLSAANVRDLALDARLYRAGDRLPCYRVTAKRGIAPGEEVLVRTYGARYWKKQGELQRKAASGELRIWSHRFLPPSVTTLIDEVNAQVLAERDSERAKARRAASAARTSQSTIAPTRSRARYASAATLASNRTRKRGRDGSDTTASPAKRPRRSVSVRLKGVAG